MKAFRTISLFVVALIAAVSCSETVYAPIENSLNAAWVGKTRADVIRSYGAPDRESSDGENGMILIYERGVEQLQLGCLSGTSLIQRCTTKISLPKPISPTLGPEGEVIAL